MNLHSQNYEQHFGKYCIYSPTKWTFCILLYFRKRVPHMGVKNSAVSEKKDVNE